MDWRKRIQSGYCKLRSQGTWREASKVFRRGEEEGWFRLRARQFAGNDSFPGPSFKGSRQQHVHCQGQRVCQQSQSARRESSLPPWTGLWQTSPCIKGTHHWRWRAVVVQRAPWQPVSKVPDSHNVVCFDAAFRITRLLGAPRHVCHPVEDYSFRKHDNGVEFINEEENPNKRFPSRDVMFHR